MKIQFKFYHKNVYNSDLVCNLNIKILKISGYVRTIGRKNVLNYIYIGKQCIY